MQEIKELNNCTICPHNCMVNRNNGQIGRCRCTNEIKIALYSLHKFEEPCISGDKGSGTIFFSNCNLNCMFCQNYKISQYGKGKVYSIEDLANIMLELQEKNANNINLVTGTMYVYQIIEAIKIAKNKGLKIPIIYNTNGYEKVETLKLLEGYIDIYLPDFKYYYNSLAKNYSGINNYFEVAKDAIKEMYRQVGIPKFNEKGIIQKGLIIRHLILPNYLENTRKVLNWINDNINKEVYISIMAQYFPTYKAMEDKYINRKLKEEELQKVIKYIDEIGIENGYIQDIEECEEIYVPNF